MISGDSKSPLIITLGITTKSKHELIPHAAALNQPIITRFAVN
jgi:hypothetical protein